MEAWIGLNGTEDISFTYDPANLPHGDLDAVGPFVTGAENDIGSFG